MHALFTIMRAFSVKIIQVTQDSRRGDSRKFDGQNERRNHSESSSSHPVSHPVVALTETLNVFIARREATW